MTRSVVCGPGALAELPGVLAERGCARVFLVTGGGSYESSGARSALDGYLAPYAVTLFSGVEENPKLEQLELGLARFREAAPDLIIGIGGGSVMDMAKLIKIFANQPKPLLDSIEGTPTLSATTLPLVAIPTTAGSGSQATHFSVLYVGRSKHSVAHPCMLPDTALVDPSLLRSVPPAIAASTGLDALNQGIESYWSIHATRESKAFAREAIERVWRSLRDIVHRPSDEVRLKMAMAAHRAGEAINITRTTAPHAISYPITSFFGVPHGHAVGLVLAGVMRFNGGVSREDCLDPRGPAYVRETLQEIAGFLGTEDAASAARAYDTLLDEIGLSRDLVALGIETREHIETIVRHGFDPQRVKNNPRRLTAAALTALLVELQKNSER